MKTMLVIFCITGMAVAQVPGFLEPVQIQADGALLDVGLMAEPFMVDWDGDGLNDLLAGQFSPGKVRFYKNVGTNNDPVFEFQNYLQADGSDITVSAG
jgi:hypothetical protein